VHGPRSRPMPSVREGREGAAPATNGAAVVKSLPGLHGRHGDATATAPYPTLEPRGPGIVTFSACP